MNVAAPTASGSIRGFVYDGLAQKIPGVTPLRIGLWLAVMGLLSVSMTAPAQPTNQPGPTTPAVPAHPAGDVEQPTSTAPPQRTSETAQPTSEAAPPTPTAPTQATSETAPAFSLKPPQPDAGTESETSSASISTEAPGAETQLPSATPFGESLPDCECRRRPRRPRRAPRLEFSFGSAELFTNQSVTNPAGIVQERVIPITGLNLFGEYLLHPRFAVMAQFLLPLEPESKLIDGELALAYVPPAISGGLRATAFYVEVMEDTTFEGQFFVLGGSTLGSLSGDAFYPTLGWRAHLGQQRGFTLYLGASFAFRQNTTALLYGVGHRF